MDTSLHLDSSNHELSFLAPPPFFFFGFKPIDFPSEIGTHVDLAFDLPLFGLGPSSKKALGSIYYGSHLIRLLYLIGP